MSRDRSNLMTALIAAVAALLGSAVGFAGSLLTTNAQLDHDRAVRVRDELKIACADVLRELTAIGSIVDDGLGRRAYGEILEINRRALDSDRPLTQAVSTLLLVAPDDIVSALVDRNVVSNAVLASNQLLRLAATVDKPDFANERRTLEMVRDRVKNDWATVGDLCRSQLRSGI